MCCDPAECCEELQILAASNACFYTCHPSFAFFSLLAQVLVPRPSKSLSTNLLIQQCPAHAFIKLSLIAARALLHGDMAFIAYSPRSAARRRCAC